MFTTLDLIDLSFTDPGACSNMWQTLLPVDAAPAPSSIGGIPNTSMTKAAAMQETLAVAEEEADRILWWKH